MSGTQNPNDFSDSDEEELQHRGYQPVLAEKLSLSRLNSPARPAASANLFPKDGVNVYTNELFHDGDVLAGEGEPPGPASPSHVARPPSSSQKMQQQKSSLAARRAERMQANIYEANPSQKNMIGRGVGGSSLKAPGSPGGADGIGRNRSMREGDHSVLHGLRSTYDPNEGQEDGNGAAYPQTRFVNSSQQGQWNQQQHQQGPYQVQAPQGPQGGYYQPPGGAPQYQQQQQQGQQPQQALQHRPNSMPVPPRLDLSDMSTFLKAPGPFNGGPVLCYIVRDKGSAKMFPRYTLFLEEGKRFLLAARKRRKSTTSNYVLSLDYEEVERDSSKYFGKLRSNFVGTEFTIYDEGEKNAKAGSMPRRRNSNDSDVGTPQSGSGPVGGPPGTRQEMACVTYQYNVLGTRGPRKMTAAVPALDAQGRRLFSPLSEEDTMLDRLKVNRRLDEIVVMRNKPPRWNEELNAYCLNFNGRVTEASVKNFQLVTDDNQGHVILQFGKIGKNTFTMDYQWPISAFQAFAICLSSFDNKLACE